MCRSHEPSREPAGQFLPSALSPSDGGNDFTRLIAHSREAVLTGTFDHPQQQLPLDWAPTSSGTPAWIQRGRSSGYRWGGRVHIGAEHIQSVGVCNVIGLAMPTFLRVPQDCRHTHRMSAMLGKPRAIDDQRTPVPCSTTTRQRLLQ
ncbi:MAG: hypothetical protein R3B91_04640 [Planctomycetaceae bacterium]